MAEGGTAAQRLKLIAMARAGVHLYGEQVGGRLEDIASFAKYIGAGPTNTAIGTTRLRHMGKPAFHAAVLAALITLSPGSAQAAETAKNPPFSCASVPPAVASIPGAEARVYRTASGRALRLQIFTPDDKLASRPAILIFFGGGWQAGNVNVFADRARAYAAAGYVAILPDYRVSCRDRSTPADAVADGKAAYAWVRAHARSLGIDLKRIVLSGGSAGGHLALMTALGAPPAERPAALVLYNPAVDLSAMPEYINLPAAKARRISPLYRPLRGLPPTIVFNGDADRTVPIDLMHTFCAKMMAAGGRCDLVAYAGQDHGFFHSKKLDPAIGTSPYADTLARSVAFLDGLNLPEFDVYLLAGQSNMSGRGFVDELGSADRLPEPRVRLYANDGKYYPALDPLDFTEGQIDRVAFDPIVGVGPGLSFARTMLTTNGGRPILLVTCAKGGSPMKEWVPDYSRNTLYGSCLARAKETGGRIAGILWYQGEADAKFPLTAAAWPINFRSLMMRFRRDLKNPKLPVTYVQISDPPLKSPNAAQFVAWGVVQKGQQVPTVPCASMISAIGLQRNPDDLHLTAASQGVLGGKLAVAMTALRARGCR